MIDMINVNNLIGLVYFYILYCHFFMNHTIWIK